MPSRAVGSLFADDFVNDDDNWFVGSDEESSYEYADGGYELRVLDDDSSFSSSTPIGEVVSDMRVSGDVTLVEGSDGDDVGLVCYAHETADRDAGYAFLIDPESGWAAIEYRLEGESDYLVQEEGVSAISALGRPSRIEADCVGADPGTPAVLKLVVNGETVARAEHRDGFARFDGLGVTVGSDDGGTLGRFDDLLAQRLR